MHALNLLLRHRGIIMILLLTLIIVSCETHRKDELTTILSRGKLPYLKPASLIQVSSYDTSGANNDRINIHEGKTATIFNQTGPGVITRIWVTIDSRDPYFLRKILLRMYWDDEKTPSVEAPVGDFFGSGFQYRHFTAEYIGMSSGGYYCYFPMPFNKSARIEVVNETGQEIYAFYYHIDYYQLNQPLKEDVAYFHAQWNRDIRTDYDSNYTILNARGQGHVVGVNMNMQSYNGSLFYLEGDEMIYIDGEQHPSVYGTGTEDYFTSGWYFKTGEFAAPYHGLIFKDDKTGRISAYRHHIPDPIPFKKSIRFTIEHGHANEQVADFSSLVYWYQLEPHAPFPEIMDASLRIPLRAAIPNDCIEAEDLPVLYTDGKAYTMDMTAYGPEWSGHKQLYFEGRSGDLFSLIIPGLQELGYDMEIFFTRGPEYGIVEVYKGYNKLGSYFANHQVVFPPDGLYIKNINPIDSLVELTFKLKNGRNDTLAVGIDAIKLYPRRSWVPEWMMIGPFPNERESDLLRFGLDEVFPPEKEIDFSQTYHGADREQVEWSRIFTPGHGYVSLWDKVEPYEMVVAYAFTYVYSPEDQALSFFIGSDDGAKVFLNGEEIYRFLDVRIAAPDQDTIPLNLKAGWNELLLKIENNFGGYAFYARILDRTQKIRYSLDPSGTR
ncbi:MAG: glycoside hydrolase family 172 protein [Bacteroidota bacterium]|nr:glycoside hydrolase family 172 protein [Bacteroidota bacterium]